LKWITTDYYKLRRPDPPEFIHTPPFPSPPGTGTSDPGPGPDDHNAWHDLLEILLAVLAWITYLAEVAAWPVDALISLITSAGTYPFRYLIYEYMELPLYNAWLALHWYLTMTGFMLPIQSEIHTGLTKLGVGVADVWQEVRVGRPIRRATYASADHHAGGAFRKRCGPHVPTRPGHR
jgi:hypothetical protein